MKILLVSSFWHPRGGDTTALFATAAGLAERGHALIPFAMRHPDNLATPWEVRFPAALGIADASWIGRMRRLPAAIWSHRAGRAMRHLLADVRPDVAHVHHLHRHLTPSVLHALREARVPIVWTVHDYELICPNAQLYTQGAPCERCLGHRYGEAVRHRCKRGELLPSAAVAIEKAVHARLGVWGWIDRLLAPSRFVADRLVRFGLPAAKVEHLPNFIAADAPVGAGGGDGWIYAGRLTAEKGVDELLAVARALPGVPGTICGDGPDGVRLRSRAPAWVRFTGAIPRDEVARRLADAAVVVVPSRWPENDPFAVLEGQRAGRPVVGSAVGGIPEQITHRVDGWLVPPHDPVALTEAVRQLLADRDEANRIGAEGRARVLRTRDRRYHLDRLESVYDALR